MLCHYTIDFVVITAARYADNQPAIRVALVNILAINKPIHYWPCKHSTGRSFPWNLHLQMTSKARCDMSIYSHSSVHLLNMCAWPPGCYPGRPLPYILSPRTAPESTPRRNQARASTGAQGGSSPQISRVVLSPSVYPLPPL